MNLSGRRVARASLVVVGIAIGVFGSPRLAAVQDAHHSGGDTPVAAVGGSASAGDHAIAERPSVSPLTGWVHQVSVGAVVLIAAALLAWTVAITDGQRVVVALLGATWRRRGPPALLV